MKKYIIDKIIRMLKYRQYEKIHNWRSDYDLILAEELPKDHVRCSTKAMVVIDNNESFSKDILIRAAGMVRMNIEKIPKGSSVIYVHKFDDSNQRINKIYNIFKESFIDMHIEHFRFEDFIINHDNSKFTDDWRIISNAHIELIQGIKVERLPKMNVLDIKIRYIGARIDDCVRYKELSSCELNCFHMTKYVKIIDFDAEKEISAE